MNTDLDYRIKLDTLTSGYDRKTCWTQAVAGAIPGKVPAIVVTMQKLLLSASDIFFAVNEMRSDDFGQTWSSPIEHEKTLGRRSLAGGIKETIANFTPQWHKKSGKLLGTGSTVQYLGDDISESRRIALAYTVYDAEKHSWSPYAKMTLPDANGKFFHAGAGCTQRVDEPDGSILLPITFAAKDADGGSYSVTVGRCAFDGRELTFVECGNELSVPEPRGLCEPSLTKFDSRYFLTMRNDVRGYVSASNDGMNFDAPRPWCFDDGTELGNYNTQQHWATHGDGLYLVYTRRGLNNDHVFRHRAPLVMARVDPDRLCVIRQTERVVVPERGARLGNFGVSNISENETWVVVAEWMQTNPPDCFDCKACEKYGSDNSVFASRIIWSKPNKLAFS